MAILASPVVLPRYYSSQSVRHLFTQQQEAKDGVTESNNDLLDDGSKKWSKHVMPSKTALAEQADETQKKQPRKRRRRRQLKPLKSVLTLTPNAVIHLKQLMNQPIPKLIRVSVRNRGCSGLSYHLEYVTKADKFDEEVTQDGVKILVDSKALFSIIGSEMDWVDNKLASKFVFKNPNSKGTCGCGESFMV
ncbi:DEKNAAC104289 [Brettanomyces naardenensis]|uniref:Iron-sulfur assembly protein 1 n=1 Tax=Brettanomyces naardenensis TaxID=13370 RepID=A0A448YQC9_BRENA|nr:DEKNAAC104289 [Brettanomyces naardenensis]